MVDDVDPLGNKNDDQVKILPPDYTLKKKIGENVDINELFSEENVSNAQKTIDSHKDKFRKWATEDVAALEAHYHKSSDIAARELEVANIEKISARLQAQAGTFDFGLATLVAKSLAKFCTHHPKPNEDQMLVIRKHVDTLSVILTKNIVGDGGAVGNELLDSLKKLTAKYE